MRSKMTRLKHGRPKQYSIVSNNTRKRLLVKSRLKPKIQRCMKNVFNFQLNYLYPSHIHLWNIYNIIYFVKQVQGNTSNINIDLNCTALRLILFYVEVQTYMIMIVSKPYQTIIDIHNEILRNIKTYFDLC